MERVFDPFFSTKGEGEGTGLGLSVAHGIVESCGGKITVDGELGKGTCLHVFLPLVEKRVAEDYHENKTLPRGTERILFVDDEEVLAEVSCQLIEEFGYDVVVCTDAVGALEAFQSEPERFDLVITDKNMPHMSGFDLAKALLQTRPGVPIILCSGFNDPGDIEIAKAIGIQEMIMKPFVMREVAQTIRAVLDQGSLTDASAPHRLTEAGRKTI